MAASIRSGNGPVEVRRLGTVDYQTAWDLQRELADARVAGGPDTLLLLQHPPVYTAGRRTLAEERPADGTPVVDTDRGGKITWHGPGQLVGLSLDTSQDYRAARYEAPTFLLTGNEAQGLPQGYAEACDLLVKIPMLGRADSLNAAVATAVMAYEVLARQT